MVALFGCAWAVVTTAACVLAVASRRSMLAWMKARRWRKSGDDTVEIVRPGLRKLAVYAALVVLALPAGVLAGSTAMPGPSAQGSVGLPLTGGTMTGQTVMCGVSTDITTCSNEDLTIAPSGTGKLVVNGGGAAPAIEVTTTATNNTAEIYERWSTSDETNTKCALLNGSATNSGVNPTLACHSDEGSGWNAFTIMGSVAAAADTGTGAAIRLYTARGTAPGTPSAALTTIPLLDLFNYTTQVIGISAVGRVASLLWGTLTNCSDGAGAAACSAAPAGSVVIDDGATTVVVSTTAVTANSQIFPVFDSSLGTKLGVTCNTTAVTPSISARVAGTSFTITAADPAGANPACFSYFIVN